MRLLVFGLGVVANVLAIQAHDPRVYALLSLVGIVGAYLFAKGADKKLAARAGRTWHAEDSIVFIGTFYLTLLLTPWAPLAYLILPTFVDGVAMAMALGCAWALICRFAYKAMGDEMSHELSYYRASEYRKTSAPGLVAPLSVTDEEWR